MYKNHLPHTFAHIKKYLQVVLFLGLLDFIFSIFFFSGKKIKKICVKYAEVKKNKQKQK